jgi:hypothetical protein
MGFISEFFAGFEYAESLSHHDVTVRSIPRQSPAKPDGRYALQYMILCKLSGSPITLMHVECTNRRPHLVWAIVLLQAYMQPKINFMMLPGTKREERSMPLFLR